MKNRVLLYRMAGFEEKGYCAAEAISDGTSSAAFCIAFLRRSTRRVKRSQSSTYSHGLHRRAQQAAPLQKKATATSTATEAATENSRSRRKRRLRGPALKRIIIMRRFFGALTRSSPR